MSLLEASKCSIYKSPSIFGFSFGLLLAIGIVISYIPQHIRIFRRKSSEGLSPVFLFVGSASGFAAFLNLILITQPARACCVDSLTVFQCINSQVGLIQVGSQAIAYILIFVLCVYLTKNSITESEKEYHTLRKSYNFFVSFAILLSITVISVLIIDYSYINLIANALGIFAAAMTVFQYFPQIYTTYNLKHTGSLSIKMMLMQTPGGFVWSYSIYSQPGSKWSSWIPYFSAAVLQGALLSMALYYEYFRDKSIQIEPIQDEEEGGSNTIANNETTPLIA
ncbi:unnamed protein product [[Candida] boidinii]|uniref:Unnamed protein product n=1 Tax=Candida boidinii TaxID=5477 RepID=A0ACB5TTA1_CANBO|nr:unnamed protein product [[Candida] boidinii]